MKITWKIKHLKEVQKGSNYIHFYSPFLNKIYIEKKKKEANSLFINANNLLNIAQLNISY